MSETTIYPVPLTAKQVVTIECMLVSAALSFEEEAKQAETYHMPRIAAVRRQEAAEARQLVVALREAYDLMATGWRAS